MVVMVVVGGGGGGGCGYAGDGTPTSRYTSIFGYFLISVSGYTQLVVRLMLVLVLLVLLALVWVLVLLAMVVVVVVVAMLAMGWDRLLVVRLVHLRIRLSLLLLLGCLQHAAR
jgi:hypothetical protein